jgi:hypothetical protein
VSLFAFAIPMRGVEAKAGGAERPLTGSGASTQIIDISTVGSATPGTSSGTAHLSHFGKSTITRETMATLTGEGTSSIEGSATVVAANGDRVFGSLTGTGAVPWPREWLPMS